MIYRPGITNPALFRCYKKGSLFPYPELIVFKTSNFALEQKKISLEQLGREIFLYKKLNLKTKSRQADTRCRDQTQGAG